MCVGFIWVQGTYQNGSHYAIETQARLTLRKGVL